MTPLVYRSFKYFFFHSFSYCVNVLPTTICSIFFWREEKSLLFYRFKKLFLKVWCGIFFSLPLLMPHLRLFIGFIVWTESLFESCLLFLTCFLILLLNKKNLFQPSQKSFLIDTIISIWLSSVYKPLGVSSL